MRTETQEGRGLHEELTVGISNQLWMQLKLHTWDMWILRVGFHRTFSATLLITGYDPTPTPSCSHQHATWRRGMSQHDNNRKMYPMPLPQLHNHFTHPSTYHGGAKGEQKHITWSKRGWIKGDWWLTYHHHTTNNGCARHHQSKELDGKVESESHTCVHQQVTCNNTPGIMNMNAPIMPKTYSPKPCGAWQRLVSQKAINALTCDEHKPFNHAFTPTLLLPPVIEHEPPHFKHVTCPLVHSIMGETILS